MKKLEQSILVMLIVTCIGMCLGSIIIAFQRSKKETTVSSSNAVNQIYYRPSEEENINRILKEQVYPALMHGQDFPTDFPTIRLLNTEESRFYFVLEMMRTGITRSVLCGDVSPDILKNQCRVLAQDFQKEAMKIFGKRINMSLIQNEDIYQFGEYIYSDYVRDFTPGFVLRFSSLSEKDGIYELVLDFYTSIENGVVNYRDVGSWGTSTLISQKYLYGQLIFSYVIENDEKMIATVSFLKS